MENLRVSVMTAICKISDNIELKEVYDKIVINDKVKYVEFKGYPNKGVSAKDKKKKRKDSVKKNFYNQLTIHIYNEKIINVKVFNNGKIQMTGIKYEKQGIDTVNILIKEFNDKIPEIEFNLQDYRIVLINTDFDIKYKVNRELLHRDICDIGIYSSFEPTIYPGVNIKYYINTNNNNGICNCTKKCNGKGNGDGDGDCKKITIAVFNSGKIIITGGKKFDQVLTCYKFINNILKDKEKYLNKEIDKTTNEKIKINLGKIKITLPQ